MATHSKNRYTFQGKVVEVISSDQKRIINALCKPGSLMLEVPDDGQLRLGDSLKISGNFTIEEMVSESFTDTKP